MVIGYWDMAASFVIHGAIDPDMFRAANTEMVATFAKLEPFIDDIRRISKISEFGANIETVVRGQPGIEDRLSVLRDQFRKLAISKQTTQP